MPRYDPVVIQKLADGLYAQANTIVLIWTVLGAALGGGGGYTVGGFQNRETYAFVGALVIGFFGWTIGMSRAFMLRVQAQTALCQKQIEENTRNRGSAS